MAPTRPVKVLLVHNRHRWHGGSDVAMEADAALLEAHGHEVVRYERDNDDIDEGRPLGRARAAVQTVWSSETRRQVAALVERERPDVAHFHNTFPLVSPSAYAPCNDAGVPVVQTIHNFRLVCPNTFLYRDGHVCTDCVGHLVPWPGVVHACYRDSRGASAVVAAMLTGHRLARTWSRRVDLYLAVTEFARQQVLPGGLPPERVAVRWNFVDAPLGPTAPEERGDFALFAGRLSEEKGYDTLLDAWRDLGHIRLKIVGDGPGREHIEARVARERLSVEVVGHLPHERVLELMRAARLFVFPARWFETSSLVVIEAFASGTPVVASRLGAVLELVADDETGFLAEPGDARSLADRVRWAWARPERLGAVAVAARRRYEQRHTPEEAYRSLQRAYETATAHAAVSGRGAR